MPTQLEINSKVETLNVTWTLKFAKIGINISKNPGIGIDRETDGDIQSKLPSVT